MKASGIKNATAGLAGAVALAGGSQAYGAVVSVTPPANFVPTSGATAGNDTTWDVNGDGTADFVLAFTQASTNGNWFSGIYGYGGVGTAAVAGYSTAFATSSGTGYISYANRLAAGATIGSGSTFVQTGTYASVLGSRYGSKIYGQFVNHTGGAASRGFIGFEFTAADGLHYGALEVSTSRYRSATNPGGQTFYSAYYQSTPGATLTIPTAAVPEPGSLAALAFGSAGVAAGIAARRRRQQSAGEPPLPA